MGNFYTNLTAVTDDAPAVVRALEALGRTAFVTPARNGRVLVYDAACEDQDVQTLSDLCRDLSLALDCPVWGVLDHDDAVLVYELWESGEGVDEYNSAPGYGSEDDDMLTEDDDDDGGPEGGDAEALAEAFSAYGAVAEIEALLSNPSAFAFAFELHLRLCRHLGVPQEWAVCGFNGLEGGDVIEGLAIEDLTRVG